MDVLNKRKTLPIEVIVNVPTSFLNRKEGKVVAKTVDMQLLAYKQSLKQIPWHDGAAPM